MMARHCVLHTDPQGDFYHCICGKKYLKIDHLRRHIRTANKRDEAKINPAPGQPGSPDYQARVNELMDTVIEMLTRPRPEPPLITVNVQTVYIYSNRLPDNLFNAKAKAS